MSELKQKSIELFFEEYGVTDPDKKAHLLTEITDIVYDYNMHIINLEKETDAYKRNQILEGIKEVEAKIKDSIEDELKK
jgi:hypothetical protein